MLDEIKAYRIKCDTCGEWLEEDTTGFSIFVSEGDAGEAGETNGWKEVEETGEWFCSGKCMRSKPKKEKN